MQHGENGSGELAHVYGTEKDLLKCFMLAAPDRPHDPVTRRVDQSTTTPPETARPSTPAQQSPRGLFAMPGRDKMASEQSGAISSVG